MKVVVVGLGPGGQFALKGIQDFSRRVKVEVVEKRPYDAFSPCALPLVVEGRIPSVENIKFQVPFRCEKRLGWEAQALYPQEKILRIKKGAEEADITYDALVLACGSTPRILPIPKFRENIGKGIHFMHTPEDTERIISHVRKRGKEKEKKAAVIGAGPLGLEAAWALREKGMEVHVFEMLPSVLPRFGEPYMARTVKSILEENGIQLHLGSSIREITADDGGITGVLTEKEEVSSDIIISGAGSVPNTELAEKAGIACAEGGGIIVDERMKTSAEEVYAAGDCVKALHYLTGKPFQPLLATPAYKQGLTAGMNAAGGDRRYKGSLGTFVTRFGPVEISSCGLSEEDAKKAGYNAVSSLVKTPAVPHYLNKNAPDIQLRLTADKDTGRVLGAQALGIGASFRVNVVSLAIMKNALIEDLSETELAYCPPVQEMYDALNMGADVLRKRLGR